MNERSVGYMLL